MIYRLKFLLFFALLFVGCAKGNKNAEIIKIEPINIKIEQNVNLDDLKADAANQEKIRSSGLFSTDEKSEVKLRTFFNLPYVALLYYLTENKWPQSFPELISWFEKQKIKGIEFIHNEISDIEFDFIELDRNTLKILYTKRVDHIFEYIKNEEGNIEIIHNNKGHGSIQQGEITVTADRNN